MSYSHEEYARALKVLQEHLPYVIQRREESGEWRNVGETVRGRSAAYARMGELMTDAMKGRPIKRVGFRVLPKNEADKYREGISAGRALGPEKRAPRRRPLMFMPEHL